MTNKKSPVKNAKNVPAKKDVPIVKTGTVREVKKREKLGLMDKFRLSRNPSTAYLVTMMFSNGTSKQWVVATTEETFTYRKRTYNLFYENSWFDLSFNMYRLYFFDDHSVPLEREIIKKGDQAWWSVKPENLKDLVKMEYVKTLAQSHEISKYLKMSLLVAVINLFVCLIIGAMIYQMMR